MGGRGKGFHVHSRTDNFRLAGYGIGQKEGAGSAYEVNIFVQIVIANPRCLAR
jgi:hypothetical protein